MARSVALVTVCDVFRCRCQPSFGGPRNQGRASALNPTAALPPSLVIVAPIDLSSGFVLGGPSGNAGGRVGDAGTRARLLATDDP